MPSSELSERSWPQCLGVFDEESCRFFLRLIGKRVVPFYPFSLGMEEVYGFILEEYGLDAASDAISVLQELLEDEEAANGLGDDGDIWRSWRHSWRHRNDDALNPFIPRAGRLILRPPTTARLRLFKAANFMAQQSRLEENEILPPNIFCPSRFTEDLGDLDKSSSKDICKQSAGYRSASSRPLCETTAEARSPPEDLRLRGGRVGSGEYHTPVSLRSTQYYGSQCDPDCHIRERRNTFEDRVLGHTDGSESTVLLDHNITDVASSSKSHPRGTIKPCTRHLYRECVSKNCVNFCEVVPRAGISQPMAASSEPVAVEEESAVADKNSANLSVVEAQRAFHRQARLIDGAIFTPRAYRGRSLNTKRSLENIEPTVINQKASAREGWLHTAWSRFRGECAGKQSMRSHSSYQCTSAVRDLSPTNHSVMTDSRKETTMKYHSEPHPAQMPNFGCDGSSDAPESLRTSTSSSANLNKPLPLSPTERRKSVTSDVLKIFFEQAQDNTKLASTASTSPLIGTDSLYGDEFHKLVGATMTGPQELPPIKEFGHPGGTSSSTSQISPRLPPPSPISFTSLAEKNPFIESPSTPRFPPPLSIQKHRISSEIWPIRQSTVARNETTLSENQAELSTSPAEKNQLGDDSVFSGIGMKELETVTEDVCPWRSTEADSRNQASSNTLTPKRSCRRSPSPVKKLLGLAKNDTPRQDTQEGSPSRSKTPGSSSKKRTIKEWGNKLRYGFLTANQEQLEQEQMMDHHLRNADVTITPPHQSSKPTFSVSIRPPSQARLTADIEVILCVTANNFLLIESKAGRISPESIVRVNEQWQARNRPQVVEFFYDQGTQRELIMANLKKVKLHGPAAEDAIAINSTFHQWRIMAKEMCVRAFCAPDSSIKRWLHDAQQVMDLLAAPFVTVLAFDDLQLATLKVISDKRRQRAERRDGSGYTQAGSVYYGDLNTISDEYSFQSLPSRTGNNRGSTSPSAASYKNGMRKRPHPDDAIMQLPQLHVVKTSGDVAQSAVGRTGKASLESTSKFTQHKPQISEKPYPFDRPRFTLD